MLGAGVFRGRGSIVGPIDGTTSAEDRRGKERWLATTLSSARHVSTVGKR